MALLHDKKSESWGRVLRCERGKVRDTKTTESRNHDDNGRNFEDSEKHPHVFTHQEELFLSRKKSQKKRMA